MKTIELLEIASEYAMKSMINFNQRVMGEIDTKEAEDLIDEDFNKMAEAFDEIIARENKNENRNNNKR